MTTDLEIGKYLAHLREEAGLKQNELAQKVTWSPTVLSRVESGERPLAPDELDSIVAAIGTEKALKLGRTAGRVWYELDRPQLGHPDESLLWEAEEVLKEIQNLLTNQDIKNSFANTLDELEGELRAAAYLVHSTEHSVAFVGEIGIGKSTAICRVSDLVVRSESTHGPPDVLEVGGGRTTVCEVQLVQGPEFGLLVEPLSEQELHQEVREFATLLKEPHVAAQDDDTKSPAIGTTEEIQRAIRNMSGLTRPSRRQRRSGLTSEDPAKTIAEKSADTDALALEILTRMKLSRRTRRELWFPSATSSMDPLLWLKENFVLVNNGRHAEFSIPKRIEVMVPDAVLGEQLLSIRLIDTKGIDDTVERADIDQLLREPNTVTVMCSKFESTPSPSVQPLLERAQAIGLTGIQDKMAILGLPQHNDALAVKDDDGTLAETTEDGYDIKNEQAETALKQIGADGVRVNFFNAFDDDPIQIQTFLLDLVKNLRARHCGNLLELIGDARYRVRNFERQQTLAVQKDAARPLVVWLKNNREIDLSKILPPERSLSRALQRAHPSSVRASVRRQGEWYNLNYSYQLGYGAQLVASRLVSKMLRDFQSISENILQDGEREEAFGLIRQARRVVQSGFDGLLEKCQLAGKAIHVGEMKYDTKLWSDCDNEWGKGQGYRDRVVDHHVKWFLHYNHFHEKDFQTLIEKEWQETLDRLSAILDEVLTE